MKNKKTVPKLRFPEFISTEGWDVLPIGEKVDFLSGYPFDGKDISENNKGTRLLRGINITEGFIRHSKDIDRYYLGKTDQLEQYHIQEFDLVIGMDGSKVGKNSSLISRFDSGALLVQRVARLRSDNVDLIRFIFLHINSTIFHAYVDRINTSSGIPHISAKQIKDFCIGFPKSSKEQQKIADCLSSLDDLITAHTKKLDNLKTHKKGLMQQLFPAEGETVPKLRFPEFFALPKWEPKTLGEICKSFSGGTPATTKKEYYGGTIPFIRSAEIDKDCTELFLTESGLKNSSAKLVKKGSVLVALYGANSGEVALCKINGAINQAILCLQSNQYDAFIYYFLLFKKSWIVETYIQGGQGNLSGEIIKSISIPFPSFKEQQKIADCLSSLDDLITAQTQKIEALKLHKKGLMQQLFPTADEVDSE